MVATIFALRRRRMGRFLPRPRSAGDRRREDEDGPEIVDIGQGRAGYYKIPESRKKTVSVILRQLLRDRDA
jgi:hypothetical protein